MTPQFADGTFPPPMLEEFPLDEAVSVYRRLDRGELKHKPVLIPKAGVAWA